MKTMVSLHAMASRQGLLPDGSRCKSNYCKLPCHEIALLKVNGGGGTYAPMSRLGSSWIVDRRETSRVTWSQEVAVREYAVVRTVRS